MKRKISYNPCLMTSSGDHHQAWEVQVQEKRLKKIVCLNFPPFWRYGQVKMALCEPLPYWSIGEKYVSLHQAKRNQERFFTWKDKDLHHLSQMECASQRYDLYCISLMLLVERSGYMTYIVLSIGALDWDFSVSTVESSNLYILGIIIFLGYYFNYLLLSFLCSLCSLWQGQE